MRADHTASKRAGSRLRSRGRRIPGSESAGPTEPAVPASVEDLAVAQGVARADDLAAIAADWPVDDDPEALDAYVRARRQERRSATLGSGE